MVHPKRLNKIKLEDVIAILTLSLFLAEIIHILHRIQYINSLKFQYCNTYLLEGFKQKNSHFNYKSQPKKHYANKDRLNNVKYLLNFTKTENKDRYLTEI